MKQKLGFKFPGVAHLLQENDVDDVLECPMCMEVYMTVSMIVNTTLFPISTTNKTLYLFNLINLTSIATIYYYYNKILLYYDYKILLLCFYNNQNISYDEMNSLTVNFIFTFCLWINDVYSYSSDLFAKYI